MNSGVDSKKYYNKILQGDQGALKRALYKSMGFTDESLSKPLIAIVNTYTNATPGHYNLNDLCESVKKGIESSGGTSMVFGTIAPCDGIAEGHDGMRYILPSRDLIASSVECMVRAHKFDGLVMLGSCDKIVPGLLMAAARINIPTVFLNGGPMYPAHYKGKDYDGNIVTEAIGWKQKGEITEEEFLKIENLAEPCVGSCAMLGTANTMGCLAEVMGMSLPGSGTVPAILSERLRLGYESGVAVMGLVEKNICARDIMTQESINNAIVALMGMGGSTNAIMHLQAIHSEAGLGELSLTTFDIYSSKIPQVASIYPASPYDMVDFFEAGGVMALLKELRVHLNEKTITVGQKTLGEILDNTKESENRNVIKPLTTPFNENGGVAILTGNLAPMGAVVKPAAIPQNMMNFSGTAHVFASEGDAIDGILSGEVKPGTVVVLRYEGPKGGPGMPEMYRPMKCLEGMGLSDTCALITDGRFSGSNRGCFVGHISPEAYEGSTLAVVENGDIIIIDVPSRKLTLEVEEEEVNYRLLNWRAPIKKVEPGYLETYKRISKSAAQGATIK